LNVDKQKIGNDTVAEKGTDETTGIWYSDTFIVTVAPPPISKITTKTLGEALLPVIVKVLKILLHRNYRLCL
jgi:hypothetical protein